MADYNVTVSLGGVGATATSGVYNVLDYGAAKDGSTDDTAAVQAAVDAATTGGGGTVWFPSGTYAIEDGITNIDSSGIVIAGDSATITWTSTTSSEYLFTFSEVSSTAGTLSAAVTRGDNAISTAATISAGDLVSIESGDSFYTNVGDGRDNKAGEMFVLEQGSLYLAAPAIFSYDDAHAIEVITPNIKSGVRGLRIVGSGSDNGTGAIWAEGCTGFFVEGCQIEEVNIGVSIKKTFESRIAGNVFSGIDTIGSGYAVAIHVNNYGAIVSNNVADRVRHFATTTAESGVSRSTFITGNIVTRSRFAAIDTHVQGYNTTISNNHISDSLTGVQVRGPHCVVSGNVLTNCHMFPYPSEYDGDSSKSSQSPILTNELGYMNLTVKDNVIIGDDAIGDISGTTLYGTGIDIRGGANSATPVFTADYINIEGNVVKTADNVGGITLYTPEGVTWIYMHGNNVDRAPYNGVRVYTSSGTNTYVSVSNNILGSSARASNYSINIADATTADICGNTETGPTITRVLALDTVATANLRGNLGFEGMTASLTDVTTFNNWDDDVVADTVTFTPATAPTPAEGMVYYDSSANKLLVYNGSAWETITSST